VALQAEHRRQRQPPGGEDRPRPHRDNHRIAFDNLAIDLDADSTSGILRDAGHPTAAQFRALRLGRVHHRGGELPGMDLRGRFGRTQDLADRDLGRSQPRSWRLRCRANPANPP